MNIEISFHEWNRQVLGEVYMVDKCQPGLFTQFHLNCNNTF